MKPTQHVDARQLLTATESVRIRKLRQEQAEILARLRELEQREIASLVEPRIFAVQTCPLTAR